MKRARPGGGVRLNVEKLIKLRTDKFWTEANWPGKPGYPNPAFGTMKPA